MKANTYCTYFYTKGVDNDLHKAAFRGNINKAIECLKHPSMCLYKSTKYRQTPLSLSISKRHEKVVHMLLDIYEKDLKFVRTFLKENNVELKTTFEYGQSYVVAFGAEQIERVRHELSDLIGDVMQKDKEELKTQSCYVILMKTNNFSEPEALFLFPRHRSDKIKLFGFICDLVKENGVCGINAICDVTTLSTVMHLAAMVGATDLVMRLMDLGGDPQHKTNYGQTPISVAFNFSEFDTFIAIRRKLGLNILELIELALANPSYNFNSESVLAFIEQLANERIQAFGETRESSLTHVLSMDAIVYMFGWNTVGVKCFEKYGEYITQTEHLYKIINSMLHLPERNSMVLMRLIEKDDSLLHYKSDRVSILHSLICYGWTNEVKLIYDIYPASRKIFFTCIETGTRAMKSAIAFNHVDLVHFLLDFHESEMKDSEIWSQLLNSASIVQTDDRGLLQRILEHPLTDPNMVSVSLFGDYENCLIGAIETKNLKNFETIIGSGKIVNINQIKSSSNKTLLSSAIYAKRPPRKGLAFASKECWTLEDKETDEEDIIEEAVEIRDRYDGTFVHATYSTDEEKENKNYDTMNEIFDMLIKIGADVFVESHNKEGLLHEAVRADNFVVAQQLLDMGLDLNKSDEVGNRPLHLVQSVKMLNLLLSKSSPEMLNIKNNDDETLLHKIHTLESAKFTDLFEELMCHGVNVNEVDIRGNSIFHFAPSAQFCELLFDHCADPHLKNANGETPLFSALKMSRLEVAAYLLRLPDLDLFDLTTNGDSYLHFLACISQSSFDDIEKCLEVHRDNFLKLCEKHGNDKMYGDSCVLYTACYSNEYVASALLVQPNLNIDVVSSLKETPLHVVGQHSNTARLLIERGASVNAVDWRNETPLHAAVRCQNLELIEVLLKAGAKINVQRIQELPALNFACLADLDVTNETGKTPFDYLAPYYKCILEDILNE